MHRAAQIKTIPGMSYIWTDPYFSGVLCVDLYLLNVIHESISLSFTLYISVRDRTEDLSGETSGLG